VLIAFSVIYHYFSLLFTSSPYIYIKLWVNFEGEDMARSRTLRTSSRHEVSNDFTLEPCVACYPH